MKARLVAKFVFVFVFAGIVASPSVGFAVTSSYGANYSYDQNTGYSGANFQNVCDQESDQDNAYSVFGTTGSGTLTVTDTNGSSGGCAYRESYTPVKWHYTCEDHDFSPDGCGTTMFTGWN